MEAAQTLGFINVARSQNNPVKAINLHLVKAECVEKVVYNTSEYVFNITDSISELSRRYIMSILRNIEDWKYSKVDIKIIENYVSFLDDEGKKVIMNKIKFLKYTLNKKAYMISFIEGLILSNLRSKDTVVRTLN